MVCEYLGIRTEVLYPSLNVDQQTQKLYFVLSVKKLKGFLCAFFKFFIITLSYKYLVFDSWLKGSLNT
jgi:hypothetical protein